MKRQELAIDKVVKKIIDDQLVEAIFLKGSIARGEDDDYSDVDLYCMVKEEKQKTFLEYLKSYKELMYISHVNFVGPQIVAVYEDGLHFDLYTVTPNKLKQTDEIKILYDPNNLLIYYKNHLFKLSKQEIANIIDEISFTLLEFYAAYNRLDYIFSSRLLHHIIAYVSTLLRYQIDPDNAQLGMKRLYKKIDEKTYLDLTQTIDLIGPSHILESIKKCCQLLEDTVNKLPKETVTLSQQTFYLYMFQTINNLK